MKFAVAMQRGRYTKTTNWTPAIISEIAGVEDRSHVTLEGVTPDGDPILSILLRRSPLSRIRRTPRRKGRAFLARAFVARHAPKLKTRRIPSAPLAPSPLSTLSTK